MSHNVLAAVVVVAAGCLVLALALQVDRPTLGAGVVVLFMVAVTLVPRSIFHGSNDPSHQGIANSSPALASYTCLAVATAYGALLVRFRGFRLRLIPAVAVAFIAWLLLEYLFSWTRTEEELAGVIQLCSGFVAWVAGSLLGGRFLRDERGVRWIAWAILALVLVEAGVTILQRVGVNIDPMTPALKAIMGTRTNGTTQHPDQLGKIVFLLTLLSLGLLATQDRRTKQILWAAIAIGFIPMGLSQGRANGLAVILMLLLWTLLLPRTRGALTARIGVPVLVIALAIPFVPAFATRFEQDPNGGPRSELAQTAYSQIAERPIWGLGANSYVTVVAPYDVYTADGYPVHNAFLLTAAELGIPGAVLFWCPFALVLLLCVRGRRWPGYQGSFAVALLAAVPGFYLVLTTGWGMLEGEIFPMWGLIMGIVYSQVRAISTGSLSLSEMQTRPERRTSMATPRQQLARPSQ
jgi:O-antigen ligase